MYVQIKSDDSSDNKHHATKDLITDTQHDIRNEATIPSHGDEETASETACALLAIPAIANTISNENTVSADKKHALVGTHEEGEVDSVTTARSAISNDDTASVVTAPSAATNDFNTMQATVH